MIKLSYWFQEGCEYRSNQETKGLYVYCSCNVQGVTSFHHWHLLVSCIGRYFLYVMSYPYSYIMMATKFLSQAVKMQMCWCAFVRCVSSDYMSMSMNIWVWVWKLTYTLLVYTAKSACTKLCATCSSVYCCLVRHCVFICFSLSNHLIYLHPLSQPDFSRASKDLLVMGWHLKLSCKAYLNALLYLKPNPLGRYIRLTISTYSFCIMILLLTAVLWLSKFLRSSNKLLIWLIFKKWCFCHGRKK